MAVFYVILYVAGPLCASRDVSLPCGLLFIIGRSALRKQGCFYFCCRAGKEASVRSAQAGMFLICHIAIVQQTCPLCASRDVSITLFHLVLIYMSALRKQGCFVEAEEKVFIPFVRSAQAGMFPSFTTLVFPASCPLCASRDVSWQTVDRKITALSALRKQGCFQKVVAGINERSVRSAQAGMFH